MTIDSIRKEAGLSNTEGPSRMSGAQLMIAASSVIFPVRSFRRNECCLDHLLKPYYTVRLSPLQNQLSLSRWYLYHLGAFLIALLHELHRGSKLPQYSPTPLSTKVDGDTAAPLPQSSTPHSSGARVAGHVSGRYYHTGADAT